MHLIGAGVSDVLHLTFCQLFQWSHYRPHAPRLAFAQDRINVRQYNKYFTSGFWVVQANEGLDVPTRHANMYINVQFSLTLKPHNMHFFASSLIQRHSRLSIIGHKMMDNPFSPDVMYHKIKYSNLACGFWYIDDAVVWSCKTWSKVSFHTNTFKKRFTAQSACPPFCS